jgi:hypothetical protein
VSKFNIEMAIAETELRHDAFKEVPCLAKQEWDRLKSLNSEIQSEAMEELMALVGLDHVKQQFLSIWAKVQVLKKQGIMDKGIERYHVIMLGNPGTGQYRASWS